MEIGSAGSCRREELKKRGKKKPTLGTPAGTQIQRSHLGSQCQLITVRGGGADTPPHAPKARASYTGHTKHKSLSKRQQRTSGHEWDRLSSRAGEAGQGKRVGRVRRQNCGKAGNLTCASEWCGRGNNETKGKFFFGMGNGHEFCSGVLLS